MKKYRVAVVLSGCGVFDGAEIHESVLSLLALDRHGAEYQCFAPDVPQHHVINHLNGVPASQRDGFFLDVNNDSLVTAADVLFVVNYLNSAVQAVDNVAPDRPTPLHAAGRAAVAQRTADDEFSGDRDAVEPRCGTG